MKKMTKKEQFKKFVSDHSETIAKVTVYTTLAVGCIAILANATSKANESQKALADGIDAYNSWADSENEWIEQKAAEDKAVFLLADWTYLVVPKDTETEWVWDRNKNPKL